MIFRSPREPVGMPLAGRTDDLTTQEVDSLRNPREEERPGPQRLDEGAHERLIAEVVADAAADFLAELPPRARAALEANPVALGRALRFLARGHRGTAVAIAVLLASTPQSMPKGSP